MNFQKVETEAQIKTVVQLAEEIWNEHYPQIITQLQIDYMLAKYQSEAAVKSQLEQGVLYYLVQRGRSCMGYFSLIADIEHNQLHLSKFYLLKNVRGRGYARGMFRFILDFMQQQQLNKICLTVNKYNNTAITVYQKLGFVKTGSIVMDIGSGFVMDDYTLEYIESTEVTTDVINKY